MKKAAFLFAAVLIATSCGSSSEKDEKVLQVDSGKLEVYYFHFTRRCATCNAVENETKYVLATYFVDKMENDSISFKSINIEEKEGRELAASFKVAGQGLILSNGTSTIDLTDDGFMYARTEAEMFHKILRGQIDKLIR